MNEIEIKKRDWKLSEIKSKFNDDDEEDKFDKNKSVFRLLRDDTNDVLKKMFELDFNYSKINRVIKHDEEELYKVKSILWKNYRQIKNIYVNGIVNSEYPVITWNDFTIICNKCKIVDKFCNLSTIDRVYIATNVTFNTNST